MWVASDLADWWDKQRHLTEQELEAFVDDNPNLFGVVLATAAATAMEVGSGTVDVLRLGEGMAEGGLKGFGKDAMRALSIAGSLGKGAKIIQTFAGAKAARLIANVPGKVCGWVSITKALRQTGNKLYASVADLLGEPAMQSEIATLAGSTMPQRIAVLRSLGAKVVEGLKVPSSVRGIESLVQRDGSVVMFGVNWMKNGVNVKHALYAFYDHLGRFRIADRTGEVVASLEELEKLRPAYGSIGSAVPHSAALLKNAFMKFVGPKGVATLAMEVLAVVHHDPETVAQSFEVRQAQQSASTVTASKSPAPVTVGLKRPGMEAWQPPAKVPATPRIQLVGRAREHTVKAGESLSKIAIIYYGHYRKWPVLYEANRKHIGNNPNVVKVGQVLNVPTLPHVYIHSGHRRRRAV